MSTYNIQITEPAENDLYEIGVYISKELLELETAKRVVSKIDNYIVFYIVTEESRTELWQKQKISLPKQLV